MANRTQLSKTSETLSYQIFVGSEYLRDWILRFQQKSKARPVSERNRVQKNNFVIFLLSCFEISGSDGNNLEFWNSNKRTNTTGRDMLKFVNLLLFLSLHELKIHEVKDSMSSLEAHILMERK